MNLKRVVLMIKKVKDTALPGAQKGAILRVVCQSGTDHSSHRPTVTAWYGSPC